MNTMAINKESSVSEPSLELRRHAQEQQEKLLHMSTVAPCEAINSTQEAADLYRSSKKLWVGSDLQRIEFELSHCQSMPSFTIRRIDGSMVPIRNPMFGVTDPIWKPFVKFQHYWYLVNKGADNALLRGVLPHSFPYYSYFVEWENQTFLDFISSEYSNLEVQFEKAIRQWIHSQTFHWLKQSLSKWKGPRKIKKLVCFGLGNLAPRSRSDCRTLYDPEETLQSQKDYLTQHAAALTIAEVFRSTTADDVEVFAQDPSYSQTSKAFLEDTGVIVVGEHGAGGFNEIDDDSAVFFRYPTAPVKQIIADIARPAIIIGNADVHILNENQYALPLNS
ncbi:hypothetical protein F4804DRAFT_63576 [Jackrogersella minutella]|nr:hypothetical protein F4804DRAFT_63576 [Jackrogersella minutella]